MLDLYTSLKTKWKLVDTIAASYEYWWEQQFIDKDFTRYTDHMETRLKMEFGVMMFDILEQNKDIQIVPKLSRQRYTTGPVYSKTEVVKLICDIYVREDQYERYKPYKRPEEGNGNTTESDS